MGRIDQVDAYIAKKGQAFSEPILAFLRDCCHEAGAEEEAMKWSVPNFLHKGGMVAGMAAFKKHVSFTLWKGKLLTDLEPEWQLAPNADSASIKFSSLDDCLEKTRLLELIKAAIVAGDQPAKPKPKKSVKELVVPDDFMAAIAKNPEALATFEKFTYSKRKDYVEWITTAKREATRLSRMAQAVEWLAEGKARHWKYENC